VAFSFALRRRGREVSSRSEGRLLSRKRFWRFSLAATTEARSEPLALFVNATKSPSPLSPNIALLSEKTHVSSLSIINPSLTFSTPPSSLHPKLTARTVKVAKLSSMEYM